MTLAQRPAKTFATIVEKLRRPGANLSSIQDIAGFRIVGAAGLTLSRQDELRDAICALFENARVDDRRLRPSAGYRAIHVIPTVDGRRVEIQLRTYLQDAWANLTEKMGDRWGRWLRYGSPPEGDPAAIPFMTWFVDANIRLSALWYEMEMAADRVNELRRRIEMGELGPQAELADAATTFTEARQRVDAHMEQMSMRSNEEAARVGRDASETRGS